MIWGSVVEGDLVSFAELLEVFAGELSTVVQDDTAWRPVVCHVLPQFVNDV